MDWILEDWEYTNDEIFAMERQKEIEAAMYRWEDEQDRIKRLPAIIKVVTPILTDEADYNTRTIRRAHQTQL